MSSLIDFFKDDRFAVDAGVELLEIAPGYARGQMRVTERNLNADGVCQGGAIFTLADLVFAAAVNSHLKHTVGTSAQITFLRPGRLGEVLTAEAHEVFDHPRLPFARVEVRDSQGELVALYSSSGYRRKDSVIEVQTLS